MGNKPRYLIRQCFSPSRSLFSFVLFNSLPLHLNLPPSPFLPYLIRPNFSSFLYSANISSLRSRSPLSLTLFFLLTYTPHYQFPSIQLILLHIFSNSNQLILHNSTFSSTTLIITLTQINLKFHSTYPTQF